MEKGACLQSGEELSSQDFRQQLDRWFERHGVLDNLRSHLRSLMVTALQRTEICLKPRQKTSPKTQSVNLLVAEYLLRHGCHYALSVLMSELPALASFGSGDDGLHCGSDKPKLRSKYRFQDREIVEILNCFGLSSDKDNLEHFCESYIHNKGDESLLECLLGLLPKNGILKTVQRCEVENQTSLSKEWTMKVKELLLAARDSSLQVSTVLTSLSRLTEEEIERAVLEESNKQMRELIRREKRIQEYLKIHEEEMLGRLKDAEKELNERRDTIDKELTDRQLHLGRMALQWQEKHSEIMALSKNFEAIRKENKDLKSQIEAMEKEIDELKLEIKKQIEIIDKLEAEKMSFKCHVQEFLRRKETEIPSNRHEVKPSGKEGQRSETEADITDSLSEAEEILLGRVKTRIKALEDESSRITENYSKYRQKYGEKDDVDSEVSDVYSKNPAVEESPEPCIEQMLFLRGSEEVLNAVPEKEGQTDDESVKEPAQTVVDVTFTKKEADPERPAGMTPTRRQQKNREYYLQSRNLLDMMEKSGRLLDATISSSGSCASFSSSGSINVRRRSGNEEDNAEEYEKQSERVVPLTDDQCLTLLKETTHRSLTQDEVQLESVSHSPAR